MSICFRQVIGERWGLQIEVDSQSERLEEQVQIATNWICLNEETCKKHDYICDISYEDLDPKIVVYGHTIKKEQMRVFADCGVDLWLSRMRDRDVSN